MSFIEIALFTLLGIVFGIASGLVPGLHVNTIAALLLASLPLFSGISAISLCACIIAMAVVNSFLSFIPSLLLGAPDSETVLSILPGHRMLLNGEAIEAIKLTALGGIIALVFVIATFSISIAAIPFLSEFLKKYMLYILLFVSCVGISFERNLFFGAVIFLLAGFFGVITLNGFGNEIVFPALSGLFGISSMLLSLSDGIKIPEQIKTKITLGKFSIIKNSLIGSVAGAVVGFLPGIGAAQAVFLVQQLNAKQSEKEFLVSNAAVNVGNTMFPLFVFYAIGKTRSGIAVAIKDIAGAFGFNEMVLLMLVALASGFLALVLHLKVGIFLTKKIGGLEKETYQQIVLGVIFFITTAVYLLTGFSGLVVLLAGTLLGLLPPLLGIRRAECMGYFVLPAILYYAGLSGAALKLI